MPRQPAGQSHWASQDRKKEIVDSPLGVGWGSRPGFTKHPIQPPRAQPSLLLSMPLPLLLRRALLADLVGACPHCCFALLVRFRQVLATSPRLFFLLTSSSPPVNHPPTHPPTSRAGTVGVVVAKLLLFLYCHGSASPAVAAFALDHLNDVLVNGVGLAGERVWWVGGAGWGDGV